MKTGTVYSGTLRIQWILVACMKVLWQESPHDYQVVVDTLAEHNIAYASITKTANHPQWTSIPLWEIFNDVVLVAMNRIAPSGYYFGAYPDNVSDFGYWPNDPTVPKEVKSGSIISGTLRSQDILLACMDVLEEKAYDDYLNIERIIAEHDTTYTEIANDEDHPFWNSLPMAWCISETLFDAMDKLSPPGYYFGAHPGDGSDFGFWPIDPEEVTITNVLDGLTGWIGSRNRDVDEKELDNLIDILKTHVRWLEDIREVAKLSDELAKLLASREKEKQVITKLLDCLAAELVNREPDTDEKEITHWFYRVAQYAEWLEEEKDDQDT